MTLLIKLVVMYLLEGNFEVDEEMNIDWSKNDESVKKCVTCNVQIKREE